jgi:hypothetical protein
MAAFIAPPIHVRCMQQTPGHWRFRGCFIFGKRLQAIVIKGAFG